MNTSSNAHQSAAAHTYNFNPHIVTKPILITHDELLDLEVYDLRAFISGFIALNTDVGTRWYYVTDVDYEEALRTISSVHLKYTIKDMVKRLAMDIFYNTATPLNPMGRPQVNVKLSPMGEGLWTVRRGDMHFRDSSVYQDVVYYPEGELTIDLLRDEIELQLIKLQKRRLKLYKLWSKAKTVQGDLVVRLSKGRVLAMTVDDVCYAVGIVNNERRVYHTEAQLINDLKWYL